MSSNDLTYTILPTDGSSDGASPTNYMTFWNQRLQTTDSNLSASLRDRFSICYLALFELPEEALSDIREEILYKVQWYQELAEYEAQKKPAVNAPRLKVRLRETRTRPQFYLPADDD